MKCPYCACQDTRVIDSRDTGDLAAIRRRRQCVACNKRFTTYERQEAPSLQVAKRDGTLEDFDRDKLEVGILKACEKRPIARAAIEAVLDRIEEELRAEGPKVASARIGELALTELRAMDEVAYLRFASVYRHFKDLTQFEQELSVLLASKPKGSAAPAAQGGPPASPQAGRGTRNGATRPLTATPAPATAGGAPKN